MCGNVAFSWFILPPHIIFMHIYRVILEPKSASAFSTRLAGSGRVRRILCIVSAERYGCVHTCASMEYAINPFKILRGLAHAQNDAYLGMDVKCVRKCFFVGRGTGARRWLAVMIALRQVMVALRQVMLLRSYDCLTASEVAPQ